MYQRKKKIMTKQFNDLANAKGKKRKQNDPPLTLQKRLQNITQMDEKLEVPDNIIDQQIIDKKLKPVRQKKMY